MFFTKLLIAERETLERDSKKSWILSKNFFQLFLVFDGDWLQISDSQEFL